MILCAKIYGIRTKKVTLRNKIDENESTGKF
jgi:hypothetical protein